jgi:iron(III) transport system substrate-binding protein
MRVTTVLLSVVVALGALTGCRKDPDLSSEAALTLVAISPHNKHIEDEFERAFSAYHEAKFGQPVEIDWRDVGGGSNKIIEFLRNIYSKAETSKIDIVWGGGEDNFMKMSVEGILQSMTLSEDVKANVPARFGGLAMYDPEGRWCGAAVSSFGFLYNAGYLKQRSVEAPHLWDDLGDARFFGLVALADPTLSGSAAMANEMIVQSGADWPTGWAKLLAVLGNAKRFYDGASGAADAVISEAPVATCIDFYGSMRVAKYPDRLVYVNPPGQTAVSPDPIGILKNPPSPELAQRFVDFVLSREGQALWALPIGAEDGPTASALMRQPIRRDVYTYYAGKLSPGIADPYAGEHELVLDVEMKDVRMGLLRHLVKAAAVDNADGLRAAKKKLIDTNFEAARLKEFNALPADLASREQIAEVAGKLHDATEAERIITDWQRFFRSKYERVAR